MVLEYSKDEVIRMLLLEKGAGVMAMDQDEDECPARP